MSMGQSVASDEPCALHGIRRCTICNPPRYRTIVADPPWPYPEGIGVPNTGHMIHGRKRTNAERGPIRSRVPLPYQTMTLDDIGDLPVSALADDDARLFLWTTNRYLPHAMQMLSGWSFEYRQTLIWDKTPNFSPLPASVAPNAAEFLLVASRGKPERIGTWSTSIVRARKPRPVHSEKPDAFLDIVEQVSPGPYAELFARRGRLGWDYPIGDQALGGRAA